MEIFGFLRVDFSFFFFFYLDTTEDRDEKSAKPQSNDRNGNDNTAKTTMKINCNNRQRAGQENVNFPEENPGNPGTKNKDDRNRKPSESETVGKPSTTTTSKLTKRFSKCPKPIYSSRADVENTTCCTKNTNVCRTQRANDTNLLFEKASLELKRQVDITKKCFNDVKSLIKNNRNKDGKNFNDSDGLSDM